MQNFLFWNINKLVCHARDQDCPCACLLQQKKNPVEQKVHNICSIFERNRLTLLFKITPSHWEYRCRDIVSSARMQQFSSHTLDETINPSRLLNQLSDVDHVDLRGCEVCGFLDTLWTQRITLTEDSCVYSYPSKSSKVVSCFWIKQFKWMHTDCKRRTAQFNQIITYCKTLNQTFEIVKLIWITSIK